MHFKVRNLLVVVPLVFLTVAWAFACVWFYGQLERKDWLPIVLSGLGLIVALLTAVWSSFEQRRHLKLGFAVTLWEKWSSAEMISARDCAWDAIRLEKMPHGRKRVGHFRGEEPDKYKAIARVNHFLADLNDFIAAGLLDLREVKALFRDTLQAYYCHLKFVDISDAFTDGTGESQQAWFEQKVLGLGQTLRLTEASGFQRYKAEFEANECAYKAAAASAANPVHE